MTEFRTDGSGYLAIQNSRPQTIGYGLVDSPLLQLAWIAEKFEAWTDLPIDRDQLLTTVSLYWFTGSGASAAHTLYEQAHSSDWGTPPAVPQGFAVFGADDTVRKLVPAPPGAHWTEFDRGGHFPAMEAPTAAGRRPAGVLRPAALTDRGPSVPEEATTNRTFPASFGRRRHAVSTGSGGRAMYTGTQLPGQPPPTRRRPTGRWVAVAAAVAVAVTAGGVLIAVGADRSAPTTGADPTVTVPAPGPAGSGGPVAAAPEGTVGSRVPDSPPAATTQWLWPFADPAGVADWQRAYRQGGQSAVAPRRRDDSARLRRLPRLRRHRPGRAVHSGRSDAYVAIGFALPDGSLHTAADVHLVRLGTGVDAPWEVVGTRDTTLTLDRPGYGSTVASPMTVGGRITGVDEQVVVTLHAQSGDLQATPAAVPAGGVRTPWSVPVRFSSGPGHTVTVAAATGGHIAAVERFAVTGVRTGG